MNRVLTGERSLPAHQNFTCGHDSGPTARLPSGSRSCWTSKVRIPYLRGKPAARPLPPPTASGRIPTSYRRHAPPSRISRPASLRHSVGPRSPSYRPPTAGRRPPVRSYRPPTAARRTPVAFVPTLGGPGHTPVRFLPASRGRGPTPVRFQHHCNDLGCPPVAFVPTPRRRRRASVFLLPPLDGRPSDPRPIVPTPDGRPSDPRPIIPTPDGPPSTRGTTRTGACQPPRRGLRLRT
jgi:hypothetical protein